MSDRLRFAAQLRTRLIDLNDTAYTDVMAAVAACEAALQQQIDTRGDSHPIIYTTEHAMLFVAWNSFYNCYVVVHFEIWDTPPPNEPVSTNVPYSLVDTHLISPDISQQWSTPLFTQRRALLVDGELDDVLDPRSSDLFCSIFSRSIVSQIQPHLAL